MQTDAEKLSPLIMALATASFGALGVLFRYGLDSLGLKFAIPIPWVTFGINVLGSFLAGAILAYAQQTHALTEANRLLLTTGLLGGFTTFSAFSLQAIRLWEIGQPLAALSFALGNPIVSILACALGYAIRYR